MDVTLVSNQNPFEQDMLSQNDCYILDNGANKKVFVWKGTENRNRVPPLFLLQFVCAAFILLNTHLHMHAFSLSGGGVCAGELAAISVVSTTSH